MSAREGSKNDKEPVSPEARRKQIIIGLVMGLIIGVVISALTQFWLWLPAGLAVGLATGAIMKPPAR
ncbi:MAG: HPP family protein [Leucobacter sp.]